ncbi:MAG: calcium/sodium antiporter [Acidobacteriota bacterium]
MPVVLVAVGIVLLGLGASWLVDGASRLALRFGVSPMVVGLTVVGFGTSMPEFMVSVLAAGRGSGALSVGNAVGSNVMNLLLVLGMAAVIREIVIVGPREELNRNMLFGLLPALALMVGAWNGMISRSLAVVLLILFAVFLGVTLAKARQGGTGHRGGNGPWLGHAAKAVVGMVGLAVGAEALVRGGTVIARDLGVSEAVIGLTLLAFGTSLPELAASVAAAFKGESEMSVGNVLGSNVFNLGLVVGSAFLLRPSEVPVMIIRQDIPLLAVVTLVLGLGVMRNGKISRLEGVGLLVAVTAYLVFVVLRGA